MSAVKKADLDATRLPTLERMRLELVAIGKKKEKASDDDVKSITRILLDTVAARISTAMGFVAPWGVAVLERLDKLETEHRDHRKALVDWNRRSDDLHAEMKRHFEEASQRTIRTDRALNGHGELLHALVQQVGQLIASSSVPPPATPIAEGPPPQGMPKFDSMDRYDAIEWARRLWLRNQELACQIDQMRAAIRAAL